MSAIEEAMAKLKIAGGEKKISPQKKKTAVSKKKKVPKIVNVKLSTVVEICTTALELKGYEPYYHYHLT